MFSPNDGSCSPGLLATSFVKKAKEQICSLQEQYPYCSYTIAALRSHTPSYNLGTEAFEAGLKYLLSETPRILWYLSSSNGGSLSTIHFSDDYGRLLAAIFDE
jgi:hypothetical protein